MTASLYVPDRVLMSWQGVGAWQDIHGTLNSVPWTPTDRPFLWYQVSKVAGQGSWWLPTTSDSPPAGWQDHGGTCELQASGPGIWTQVGSRPVQRPAVLYWWLPLATESEPTLSNLPGDQDGEILGSFPEQAPGGGPPSDPFTVETTATGVIVNYRGGPPLKIAIQVAEGTHDR